MSIGQEAAGDGQELVQLIMVRPVSSAVDVHDLRVLEMIGPAVGCRIRCPGFAAADQQRRAGDAAPERVLGVERQSDRREIADIVVKITERLEEVNDLPSPGTLEVTKITLFFPCLFFDLIR